MTGKELEQVFEAELGTYVKYDSNNSGGSFWLSEEDWVNLEKAGWIVSWGGHGFPPKYKTYEQAKAEGGYWLGTIACAARRYGLSLRDAIAEWTEITGQNPADEGCGCCGPPHSFDEYDMSDKYIRGAHIETNPTLVIE